MNELLEFIKFAETNFPGNNSRISRYEAEEIISHVLNIKRLDIYISEDLYISDSNISIIKELFNRRINEEPLQYILGLTQFMDLELKVDKNVLIPRPETEILVEECFKIIDKKIKDITTICDVGTGSGAISLSIANKYPSIKVYGVDLSQEALRIARENQRLNSIKNTTFLQSDLLDNINIENFDIIVANLPYIPMYQYKNLDSSVICYEPKNALTDGGDGLSLVKKLIKSSQNYFKSGGNLLLEIGYDQGKKVSNYLNDSGYENINLIQDLHGLDRIVTATFSS